MGQSVTDINESVVEMRIIQEFPDSKSIARLCSLLGLEEGQRSFALTTDAARRDGQIAVATRSLMASLFYVSQSVEPPMEDKEAGRVTVTCDSAGNEFDWRKVTGGLMQICSSNSRPDDAYVAVRYRGSWFYIDDSDLTSKSTFSLLTQLFALQAGEIRSTGPILTLPVAN